MWGMYDLSKAYRSMQKSIANRRVEDWEASNGRNQDTTWLFHGPWQVSANKYVRSHLACEIAWRHTPETGSGDVAFTNWAAQVKMQK